MSAEPTPLPEIVAGAIYLDGERGVWVGTVDGDLTALERVDDEDRYANRSVGEIAMFWHGVTCIWKPES